MGIVNDNVIKATIKGQSGPPWIDSQVNPWSVELILHKSWRPKGFNQFEIIMNVLVSFFPIHLNTYVMGLRPLEIFLLLQCGDRL